MRSRWLITIWPTIHFYSKLTISLLTILCKTGRTAMQAAIFLWFKCSQLVRYKLLCSTKFTKTHLVHLFNLADSSVLYPRCYTLELVQAETPPPRVSQVNTRRIRKRLHALTTLPTTWHCVSHALRIFFTFNLNPASSTIPTVTPVYPYYKNNTIKHDKNATN